VTRRVITTFRHGGFAPPRSIARVFAFRGGGGGVSVAVTSPRVWYEGSADGRAGGGGVCVTVTAFFFNTHIILLVACTADNEACR